jgi:hypothetical protein
LGGVTGDEDAWVDAFRHLNKTHGPIVINVSAEVQESQDVMGRISAEFDCRVGVGEVDCPEGDCKAGFRSIYVDERGAVHRCARCPEVLGTIMWPHLPRTLGKATPCDKMWA